MPGSSCTSLVSSASTRPPVSTVLNLNRRWSAYPRFHKGHGEVMERNKWETAIRCLEVALHPHTSDDEVLAGVNGFRRTADGMPLSQVCGELAGGGLPLGPPAELTEKLARLGRENLELRRKLAVEEAAQA